MIRDHFTYDIAKSFHYKYDFLNEEIIKLILTNNYIDNELKFDENDFVSLKNNLYDIPFRLLK